MTASGRVAESAENEPSPRSQAIESRSEILEGKKKSGPEFTGDNRVRAIAAPSPIADFFLRPRPWRPRRIGGYPLPSRCASSGKLFVRSHDFKSRGRSA